MEQHNQTQNQSHHLTHTHSPTWGTWEELLLACAVKRHGFKNWDSVAMEVQTKSSLPHLLTTAENCQQKYHDLHRRFTTTATTCNEHDIQENNNNNNNNDNNSGDKVANIPWLEELRKLRVAELKQEVQRYDVSILSLQLKVKRLEEEREKSVQGNQNDDGGIPDLEQEASQNDKKDEPEKKDSVSGGEESDRENRSVNESNSTGSEQKTAEKDGVKMEAEPVQEGPCEAAPVLSVSNSKPVGGGGEESHELGDSVTQLSSEVQSSASLGRKRKRKERKRGEEIGGDGIKGATVKSEPLIGLIEMIRAHRHGSLFEGRLETQETDAYKNMVRQHLDLETIETKLEQGSYSSSNLSFYRDLLLLVNNAIVFFPKSSTESLAAYELRLLLSNEMKKETQKSEFTVASQNTASQPKSELERSNSLLKGSAPIVVCRKRSSLSAKPSSSGYGQKIEQQQQPQQSNDTEQPSDPKPTIVEQSTMKIESKEKPATGTRSSRRTNKNLTKVTSAPSKKQNASPTTKADADKPETPKTDKKKTEALALDKKRSAVDFLKRIKKNSPVETSKNTRGGVNGSGDKKTDGTGKVEKGKERVLRRNNDEKQEESSPSKRNVGRPSKKGAETSKVSGKRGREGSGKEAAKRPTKRSRR
ncbi:hypothetical protein P3X46_024254 [Hevea brasiliensis]|uniref:Bromo domain-containing protein n=1 Tax=Hevea brasiliensis TaxID=3981 RepID=A0ABQ9L2Z5_HEVBR|nr:uncharacterized protein LOC110669313 [Hevea brasiliensis]KAJ9158693.1 hypothetical protein P3X46_024254 [Hevea brasiliensis]